MVIVMMAGMVCPCRCKRRRYIACKAFTAVTIKIINSRGTVTFKNPKPKARRKKSQCNNIVRLLSSLLMQVVIRLTECRPSSSWFIHWTSRLLQIKSATFLTFYLRGGSQKWEASASTSGSADHVLRVDVADVRLFQLSQEDFYLENSILGQVISDRLHVDVFWDSKFFL